MSERGLRNLAYDLGRAPKGLKLWSERYGEVYYDHTADEYNRLGVVCRYIYIKIKDNGMIRKLNCHGCEDYSHSHDDEYETYPSKDKVIYDRNAWINFYPCNDGDILIKDDRAIIFWKKYSYDHQGNGIEAGCYISALRADNRFVCIDKLDNGGLCANYQGLLSEFRYADEREVKEFLEFIKREGYEWDAENRIIYILKEKAKRR